MRLFIAVGLFLASLSVAHAQSTLQQNLSTQKQPKFSGNLSLGYNSNLARQTDSASEQSVSSDVTLNYRLKPGHLLRGYVGGFKEVTQGQEWKPQDSMLAWVSNGFWGTHGKLTIGQQVRLNLPTSRESRDRDYKVAGVSLVPVLMATLSPSVTLVYLPQITRNFHTYRRNRPEKLNAEWSTNHVLVGVVSITDALYFQPVFSYGQAWQYGGRARDPSYQAAGEMGYSLKGGVTLAAGWTNAGFIRRFEQASDQSFEVFDNNNSTVYSALYWVF